QALASKTDSYQRSRTGRLNAEARSFEVQFVRNPGRQIVLLVSNHELERTDRFHDLRILKQVRKEVAIISGSGKDTDLAFEGFGIVRGVFQGCPSGFEKKALLWIGYFGFPGIDVEERGVKEFYVLDDSACLDEVRVL